MGNNKQYNIGYAQALSDVELRIEHGLNVHGRDTVEGSVMALNEVIRLLWENRDLHVKEHESLEDETLNMLRSLGFTVHKVKDGVFV